MAVILKNMSNMPESCEDCPWCKRASVDNEDKEICWLTFFEVTDLFLLRHDECPLEEIK